MSKGVLFDDIFEIRDLDRFGKHFEKVSRVYCSQSENLNMDLALDVNVDIYPVKPGEKLLVTLRSTLNADGTPDSEYYVHQSSAARDTIVDAYEYVMHGKVFKFLQEGGSAASKMTVLISFGGLLMELKGDARNLQAFELNSRLYLLIRKA